MPDDDMRTVMRNIELDNVELRRAFLRDTPCYTSRDIHKLSGARQEHGIDGIAVE